MIHPHPGELLLAYDTVTQKLMRARVVPNPCVKVQTARNSGGLIHHKFWSLSAVDSNHSTAIEDVIVTVIKVQFNTATIRIEKSGGSKTIKVRIQNNGDQILL